MTVRIGEVGRVVAVHAGDLPDVPDGARWPRDRDPLGHVLLEEQHLAELGDRVVLILVVVWLWGGSFVPGAFERLERLDLRPLLGR